jgi:curved DNA-binding protein CbpA
VLSDYLILGLDLKATDEQIRQRYLALIKTHSPEKDPQRFQDISHAYERIQDRRSRVFTQIFGYRKTSDLESSLRQLLRAAKPERKRVGLQELLDALKSS